LPTLTEISGLLDWRESLFYGEDPWGKCPWQG
jgi:hypothetical protein